MRPFEIGQRAVPVRGVEAGKPLRAGAPENKGTPRTLARSRPKPGATSSVLGALSASGNRTELSTEMRGAFPLQDDGNLARIGQDHASETDRGPQGKVEKILRPGGR